MGGHRVQLLRGGDALFPAMLEAIASANREIWLASYIFYDDEAAHAMAHALVQAVRRGVRVSVVVDGFGSKRSAANLRRWLVPQGVALVVFRPLDHWRAWLQPGHLRRMHHKLCTVDDDVGFVGGINLIDDRRDVNHGQTETPRLDFAVAIVGPLVPQLTQTVRALWTRAAVGQELRQALKELLWSSEPMELLRDWLSRTRLPRAGPAEASPVRVALVLRDNVRRRGAIERSYIEAIQQARTGIDMMCPYFFPGQAFWRALLAAAQRGVRIRLVLMGKVDYRIAAWASQALYDGMLAHGMAVHEYMPAYLHAKVAVVDGQWATIGSSNIDPMSLWLNLEANVVIDDAAFAQALTHAFEDALTQCRPVTPAQVAHGWRAALRRGTMAWLAQWYLRLAGVGTRY